LFRGISTRVKLQLLKAGTVPSVYSVDLQNIVGNLEADDEVGSGKTNDD
jgi:hypothetical protein